MAVEAPPPPPPPCLGGRATVTPLPPSPRPRQVPHRHERAGASSTSLRFRGVAARWPALRDEIWTNPIERAHIPAPASLSAWKARALVIQMSSGNLLAAQGREEARDPRDVDPDPRARAPTSASSTTRRRTRRPRPSGTAQPASARPSRPTTRSSRPGCATSAARWSASPTSSNLCHPERSEPASAAEGSHAPLVESEKSPRCAG